MELWDFAKIMAFVRQQVEEEKSRNRRLEGQEFPDYERQQELLSGGSRDGAFSVPGAEYDSYSPAGAFAVSGSGSVTSRDGRRTSTSSGLTYRGRKMPCLLFQASQNRNLSHRHDFTEMVYVCSGTYTTEIEGEICVFGERDLCPSARGLRAPGD